MNWTNGRPLAGANVIPDVGGPSPQTVRLTGRRLVPNGSQEQEEQYRKSNFWLYKQQPERGGDEHDHKNFRFLERANTRQTSLDLMPVWYRYAFPSFWCQYGTDLLPEFSQGFGASMVFLILALKGKQIVTSCARFCVIFCIFCFVYLLRRVSYGGNA